MPSRTLVSTMTACFALSLLGVPLCTMAQTPGAVPSASPTATDASPSPSGSASPLSVDPAIASRAENWLRRVQNGNIDRSQLTDQMNRLLSDDLVKSVSAQFGPLGEPTAFSLVTRKTMAPNDIYVFRATFKTATWLWVFATDASGKVSGLRFLPPQ